MKVLKPEFVEFIPKVLEDDILYISIRFRTAVHKCACGCGNKTVTRFSPTDWELTFNGIGVSLYPSIGNWGFPCQSHYWIKENNVEWAEQWSRDKIIRNRIEDKRIKDSFYSVDGADNSEKQIDQRQNFFHRMYKILTNTLYNNVYKK